MFNKSSRVGHPGSHCLDESSILLKSLRVMCSIQAKSCRVVQYSPVAFNCIIYLPISIYLIKCGNTAKYSWSCDWRVVCLESVATTSPGSEHFRRVAKDNKVHVRSAQHSSLNKKYRIIIFKTKIML